MIYFAEEAFLTLFLLLTLLQMYPFPPFCLLSQPHARPPSGYHHTVVCISVSGIRVF